MIDRRDERLCVVSIDDFGWDEIRGWSEDEWLENATRRGWVYDSLIEYQRDGLAPRGDGYVLRIITISITRGAGR